MIKKYLPAVLWVIGFQVISSVIGLTTAKNMDWYNGLNQPALTPPDIAFPIVWTSLYIMLALAGYLVWQRKKQVGLDRVYVLYWIQMILNWGWSFVFFGLQMITFGFVWICALNIAMIAFVIAAWPHNRKAALLVIPTILWGCFAGYLNFQIMVLN